MQSRSGRPRQPFINTHVSKKASDLFLRVFEQQRLLLKRPSEFEARLSHVSKTRVGMALEESSHIRPVFFFRRSKRDASTALRSSSPIMTGLARLLTDISDSTMPKPPKSISDHARSGASPERATSRIPTSRRTASLGRPWPHTTRSPFFEFEHRARKTVRFSTTRHPFTSANDDSVKPSTAGRESTIPSHPN